MTNNFNKELVRFEYKATVNGGDTSVFYYNGEVIELHLEDIDSEEMYESRLKRLGIFIELEDSSRSGLTREYHIMSVYPLLELGWYRVNTRKEKNTVELFPNSGIFLYYPVNIQEEKTENSYPVIITDGGNILNIHTSELKNFMDNYFPIDLVEPFFNIIESYAKKEEREIKSFTLEGYSEHQLRQDHKVFNKMERKIDYYFTEKSESLRKKDLVWFSMHIHPDYSDFARRYQLNHISEFPWSESRILNDLGICEHNLYNFYLYFNKYGILDKIYLHEDLDKLFEDFEIDIYKDENGQIYFYRFFKDKLWIETTIESKLYEYEVELDRISVFGIEKSLEFAVEQIKKKYETDKFNKLSEEEKLDKIRNLLMSRKNLTIQDSYNVGNCKIGTKSFMERYNLPEELNSIDLYLHKEFNTMINNNQFKRVLIQFI